MDMPIIYQIHVSLSQLRTTVSEHTCISLLYDLTSCDLMSCGPIARSVSISLLVTLVMHARHGRRNGVSLGMRESHIKDQWERLLGANAVDCRASSSENYQKRHRQHRQFSFGTRMILIASLVSFTFALADASSTNIISDVHDSLE